MIITAIREVQQMGGGSLSINTILTYYEYYMKFQAYITMGNGKMDAYTFAACDCCVSVETMRNAVRLVKMFNNTNKN